MMKKKKVVMIGLRASVVDFEKWPELSEAKLEEAFERVLEELTIAGYEASWCLIDTGETAAEQIRETLVREEPRVVLIGAGVRGDPDHFLLFEEAVNLVHRHAPGAAIAFNTSPFDSVEAVKRWS